MVDGRSDGELVSEYLNSKSQAAFAVLVNRHMDFVYGLCRYETGDAEMAADVAQAVFLILADKAKAIASRSSIRSWLYKVSRLACRNAMRVEMRRIGRERRFAEAYSGTVRTYTKVNDYLYSGLDVLSPRDREALLLRYWDDIPVVDVARLLDISEEAARKRIARAQDRLKRYLMHHGVALSTAGLAALFVERRAVASAACLSATTTSATASDVARQIMKRTVISMRNELIRRISVAVVAACLILSGLTTIAHAHFARHPSAVRASIQMASTAPPAANIVVRTQFVLMRNSIVGTSSTGQNADTNTMNIRVNGRSVKPDRIKSVLSDLPISVGSGRILTEPMLTPAEGMILTGPALSFTNGNEAMIALSGQKWLYMPALNGLRLSIAPSVDTTGTVTLSLTPEVNDLHPRSNPAEVVQITPSPMSVSMKRGDTVMLTDLMSTSNASDGQTLVIFLTI